MFACGLFGYAAFNSLVLYRRMRRRIADYKNLPLERMVRSPQYSATMWLSGAIGIVGFAIASWQLVLSLFAIMRG
ncbi:MAG TPA: hypothetical protein VJN94_03155 [Candidatus Binataceae bacterium]|nr:hypothetical protein [Candidatus Binataceae bacterium]